jgi:predicted short-subunit dehydrogenase-like oxidoreductase (DUF2520 family)
MTPKDLDTPEVREPRTLSVVGVGRAGGSFALACAAIGWRIRPYNRHDDYSSAAHGADLVLICTPDREIANVAAAIQPQDECVVGHVSGSLGLDVLEPHHRRVAVHPLMTLPDPAIGAGRLRSAWFAVAGDEIGQRLAEDLGGRWFPIEDASRPLYHATATIASNHLVALLGQVERLAATIGIPFDAFLELGRVSFEGASGLGPGAALTGPAARGDDATIEAHRAALADSGLDPVELLGYDGCLALARYLAAHRHPRSDHQ